MIVMDDHFPLITAQERKQLQKQFDEAQCCWKNNIFINLRLILAENSLLGLSTTIFVLTKNSVQICWYQCSYFCS